MCIHFLCLCCSVNPAGDGQRYKIKELETEELVSVISSYLHSIFFLYKNVVFSSQAEYFFSRRFQPENVLVLFLNYNWKERICDILFAVCSFFLAVFHRYVFHVLFDSLVHRDDRQYSQFTIIIRLQCMSLSSDYFPWLLDGIETFLFIRHS